MSVGFDPPLDWGYFVCFRAAFLALVLVAGPGAVRSPLGAQGAPDSSRAPRTADELIQRFRAAHQARSVADIAHLIYWGGVGEYVQRSTERQIVDDFPLTIARVTIQLLSADEFPHYSNDAKTYRPAILVTHRMRVEFLSGSASSGGVTARLYLVGVKQGTFYLIRTEPVRG